eukprot:16434020-Heterocapsa_arctica.AAC.1
MHSRTRARRRYASSAPIGALFEAFQAESAVPRREPSSEPDHSCRRAQIARLVRMTSSFSFSRRPPVVGSGK